jgi:hypothetical protein
MLTNWDGTELGINASINTDTGAHLPTSAKLNRLSMISSSSSITNSIIDTCTSKTSITYNENNQHRQPFAIVNSIELNSPTQEGG